MFPDIDQWRKALEDVLTAYVRRNHSPGYCQGQNQIAAFLLLHMNEELTFWTMCTIVEDLRGADFYAKPPASMNGFMVEMNVINQVAAEEMPEFQEALGGAEQVQLLVELLSPKVLIPLFVDALPIRATVVLWEELMCSEGGSEVAAVHAILTLLQVANDKTNFKHAESALQAALEVIKDVDEKELKQGMKTWAEKLSMEQVLEKRGTAKAALAARWTDGTKWLRTLSRNTHFKQEELIELQKVFQEKCAGEEGLTKSQFAEMMDTLPHKLPQEYLEHLYKIVDEDGNDSLDFREVCCWLSILTRGSLTERLQLCFNLYDVDRSGLLESAEIMAMAKALSKTPDGSENERTSVMEFEKKIRQMDVNNDCRISFLELHSGVSADMEMQMLLGCGDEAEAVGGEDDEDGLCALCKVELDAMQAVTATTANGSANVGQIKDESKKSRKYVRLLVLEAYNVHPRIQKAYLQVSHSTGDQRTGLARGAPKDMRMQFAYDQSFHIPFTFEHAMDKPGTFKSECVTAEMFDTKDDGRVIASAELDIADHINESQSRVEISIEMDPKGNLELLRRHSLGTTRSVIVGDGIPPDTPNPILKLMLATHDCEGLHKDFSPLSFTFSRLQIRIQEDHIEKAPEQIRLEISRAGRSVQSPMVKLGEVDVEHIEGKEWGCIWDPTDALRVAMHMFFSDSYENDGTYMQKNILLTLKDAGTGTTFAAARLDLSMFFTRDVNQQLLELDLFEIDPDQDSMRWLKSGWMEFTAKLGLGDPAAKLSVCIGKEDQSAKAAAVLSETPRDVEA